MKTIFYISIIFMCLFFSFTISNNKYFFSTHPQNVKCLKELKQDVKRYWRYDEKGKYYVCNDTFLYRLYESKYSCMKGMDTSAFYKIFGKQHRLIDNNEGKGYIGYLSQRGIKGQWNLMIYFDKQGKLTNINAGIVESGILYMQY